MLWASLATAFLLLLAAVLRRLRQRLGQLADSVARQAEAGEPPLELAARQAAEVGHGFGGLSEKAAEVAERLGSR